MERHEQLVTKADLAAAIEAQDQRFQGRMDVLEQRLTDRIVETVRETETRLLQAFYAFAESNDKRHSATEGTVAGVVNRLTALESRLLTVEKKLNLPPGA